jgi:hypothetical protein
MVSDANRRSIVSVDDLSREGLGFGRPGFLPLVADRPKNGISSLGRPSDKPCFASGVVTTAADIFLCRQMELGETSPAFPGSKLRVLLSLKLSWSDNVGSDDALGGGDAGLSLLTSSEDIVRVFTEITEVIEALVLS